MKTIRFFLAVIIILAGAAAAHAFDFSADTETVVNGTVIKGKFYYRDDRRRIEGTTGDKRQISIVRMDKKLVWHIADQQKKYLELRLTEKDMVWYAVGTVPGEIQREQIGREMLRGRSVTKWRVRFAIEKNQNVIYQWIDDEYRVPVKISDEEGKFISEFINIKEGPQPDALFELPAGLTKYAIDGKTN